jgi:signal transduction histidine kinase
VSERLRRLSPFAVDALLAGVIFVAVEAEILTSSARTGALVPTFLVTAGATLPFAFRRTHTTLALCTVVAFCLVDSLFLAGFANLTSTVIVPLLIGYTVGTQYTGRAAWIGLALAVVASAAILDVNPSSNLGDLVFLAFYVIAAWYIGRGLQSRAALNEALREKALRIDAAREETARTEVAAERARIARELHDVVAHGVSVMVVQAGGARRQLRADPDRAREALDAVESSGREALVEMRRLVGVMRPDAPEAPGRAPAPGLERLDDLVDRARDAGLPVELRVEGERDRLTAGIDLAAFRVVQEALTNTIKHAGAAHAAVTVRYRPEAVELEVADDGRGEAPDVAPPPGGHGLVGMRERVAMYGGELETGARAEGGFAVKARLPR